MTCKCLAFVFAFPLTFDPVLYVLVVAFDFLEFTKFLVMVFGSITYLITLHIMMNLWQGSRTNRMLVIISQSKFIMHFCLEDIMNKI
jgi:hypothetical protein